MKKKLFFKFFVLAAMALFTITACQNDDVNVNEPGEFSQAEYTAMLNTLKSKVNGVIDAHVNTLAEELNVDKASLRSAPGDKTLQVKVVATAIQIEGLNAYKTRAAEGIETLSMPEDCYPDNLKMALSDFNGTWNRTWVYYGYNYSADIHEVVNKFNALIEEIKRCSTGGGSDYSEEIEGLHGRIDSLINVVETNRLLLVGILNIYENAQGELVSGALENIWAELGNKADKFELNEKIYNLETVYDELQDSLAVHRDSLAIHRIEIDLLKERVTYIEEVELPAIWEGISILYEYIGDVYNNLDQRVTGLTFKPDYDFGPGLSSLILVRGLSEWENIDVEGGFGWQPKTDGSVYKGITWLTYNVSPANAEVDTESLELLYTTTTMITRSTSDPLLQIVNEDPYLITFEDGVLRVPVRIHSDAYPLVQTSFDPDAKENIKVALQVKNKGITAPEEPTRPVQEPSAATRNGNGEVGEDRSVVSSEYVTVWLGLFDGRIAEKDVSKTDNIGPLFPTGIITADFLAKDCDETDYPLVTLWVGDGKPNTVTVQDSVLAVFFNEFEKKYSLPADYLFTAHTLSYELVDLGNGANGLVQFNTTNGKIDVTQQNRAAATGKTLAVLVKAKVGNAVHALGYVRVIIAGPEKELITITNNLTLPTPVIINCSAWTEFTVRNTVSTFINTNIINSTAVNQKTNITNATAFYQKYTGIEINSVIVTNSTAQLPALTEDELKALVAFEYVTTGTPYIKGTVSNEAPLGNYTVVTTLKSNEYIPDLQVTWKFSVRDPQLRPSALLVNGQFMITLPAPSPNITASYTGSLNSAFLQQNGKFTYNYLNPSSTACSDFITPYFIFKEVPAGYDISEDGKTVLKGGVAAAVIEETDGVFTVRLIEGPAAHGLVGNNQVKVEAKGEINEGVYVIYPSFGVVFVAPLSFSLPTAASFTNNQFSFNLYAVGWSGADIIRAWNGTGVPLKNNKESAKLLIDYYGINYTYDETYSYGNNTLGSALKLDLANISYASGSSNTFGTPLSNLGATVTVGQFYASDVEQYYNILTPIRYRLAFNRNGATLPANLRISIPITMEHRWGVTEGSLVIRVN